MAEAEPPAPQPKVKVLRRTSISPKYIKADAELQRAATQYLTAIAESSDKLEQVEEACAKLKQKLVPKLGFDGKVDWRVIADERVKGGLIVEEIQIEPANRPRD
jgi:ABC-type Na+ efflux pump permease subunit